jgi:hypothetical protein
MSTSPALATIAALHTLLTERPDLAAMPIRWSVRQNGDLHASPPYLAEGSHRAVRALAAAIGAETCEYTVMGEKTGEEFAAVSIEQGNLAGASVHSHGYVLVVGAELVGIEDGAR